jgi:hypothetical protein
LTESFSPASKADSFDERHSRKHVACLHPSAMQLHRAPPPIEAWVGFARARIWTGSVDSYGLPGMLFFASTFWKKLQAKMEKSESPKRRKLQAFTVDSY